MPVAFRIKGAHGVTQIDRDYNNLALIYRGDHRTTAFADGGSGQVTDSFNDVQGPHVISVGRVTIGSIRTMDVIVATRCTDGRVVVSVVKMTADGLEITFHSDQPIAASVVSIYVFGQPPKVARSGVVCRIMKPDGSIAFDMANDYLVMNQMVGYQYGLNDTGSGSGGGLDQNRQYAAVACMGGGGWLATPGTTGVGARGGTLKLISGGVRFFPTYVSISNMAYSTYPYGGNNQQYDMQAGQFMIVDVSGM